MSNKLIVLDTRHQEKAIYDLLGQMIASASIDEAIGVKLSKDVAQQFLHLMVENIVESLVSYKTAKDQYTNLKMAAAIFNCAVTDVDSNKATWVENLMKLPYLETIYLDIYKQVAKYIDSGTWIQWDVVKAGSVITLISGKDYRIAEYDRVHGIDNGDDHAVVSLNLLNPLNYLFSEFLHTFFHGFDKINLQTLGYSIYESRRRTQLTLANGGSYTLNKDHITANHAYNIAVEYIQEQLTALLIGVIVKQYSNIKVSYLIPKVNHDFFASLGLDNLLLFEEKYISPLVSSINMAYFSTRIEHDVKYELEYHSYVISVYKNKNATYPIEKLVFEYQRGDYLPDDQRAQAERYILENNLY
ncbi:hypothetical protein PAZH1_58 [Pseudomonas phage PA_ZH1]|nr:hypothetical protein PAZH1_58 [Pseudomonas phage PA_ZH1]